MPNLLIRSSKIDEHFPDQNAPTFLLMSMLHLDQPTLQINGNFSITSKYNCQGNHKNNRHSSHLGRGLLILLTQKKFQGIPLDHVLQHPDPLLHDGLGVRRQVVGLGARPIAGGNLECVAAVGARYPTTLIEDDHTLWLAMQIML